MTIDTEIIRNAAGTLDVITSNLAAEDPLRLEASEGAKGAVASLYRIADTIDAQAAEIARLRDALAEIVAAADGDGWSQLDPSFEKARAALSGECHD